METLRSPSNPLLKKVRRAVQRGGLTDDGYCLAETFRLLEEAIRSGCEIGAVLGAESARHRLGSLPGGLAGVRLAILPDSLFRELVSTGTSQGVVALVRPREWKPEDLSRRDPLVVVLDGTQDPGNTGAIVRAAEAFGSSGLIFLKGTVNPFNPKAVRASAGSLFRIPVLHGFDAAGTRRVLDEGGLRVYAAAAEAGSPPEKVDMRAPCAIIIGSEGHGVSAELREGALAVRIPTDRVESLNAAVAAGILLYEARRQRLQAR